MYMYIHVYTCRLTCRHQVVFSEVVKLCTCNYKPCLQQGTKVVYIVFSEELKPCTCKLVFTCRHIDMFSEELKLYI